MCIIVRVRGELEQQKRIRSAQVTQCSDRWLGCFEVAVDEHRARFISVVGDRVWVASDQGVLLDQLPAKAEGEDKAVSYTHLRAHETVLDIVCRLLHVKNNDKTYHKLQCVIF